MQSKIMAIPAPLTENYLFQLENAGIRRASRWLVRHVSLSMKRGQIMTLIGPNGSGKSTTAKMALGLIPPDEGKASRQTNMRIGYVPQKLALDWTLPLTVHRFMTMTDQFSRKDIMQALEQAGVTHVHKQDMRSLSGGEFQRVLLARAIARKPDLLVLDEPVQGVDYKGQNELYALIRSVRDQLQCGVLMISHDLHVVMAATDHVICLNGHICCEGHPRSVIQTKEYQNLFGVHNADHLAVYAHAHDHEHS
jgi:zinc transport system ATP-binding protein